MNGMRKVQAAWQVTKAPTRVTPRQDGNRAQRRAWEREHRTRPQEKPPEEEKPS